MSEDDKMSKTVKEKLKDKRQRDHEKYRDELLEDFNALFEDWKSHSTQHRRQWNEQYQRASKQIEDSTEQIRKVTEELRAIRLATVGEVKKLKKRYHWELSVACLLAAFVGGLLAVWISG